MASTKLTHLIQTPQRAPRSVDGAVTIRRAGAGDRAALRRLALLDSRQPLEGEVLLAELDGAIHAAISVSEGGTIADPFRPTASLVQLLEARAAQLAPVPAAVASAAARRSPAQAAA